ncbi:MAG: NAD(P)/FAD-dependent oxidoreductase [Bdellovibrionales bacterium]|nr:NAD(P)/FAD-dependent oxidoreductase [Bdellovibrionales bacterium]
MQSCDVVILGAGGAGLMCSIEASKRGRQVIALDHAKRLGGKILISGGGRCNFTNLGASPANYKSQNPHFCKSALSRYPSQRFIDLVEKYGIAYHEKKLGQLFCDHSAQSIVDLLEAECQEAGAEIWLDTKIEGLEKTESGFRVTSSRGALECQSVVVATGGLSIPKIGATGLGYELAQKFGHRLIERAPALDGFTLGSEDTTRFGGLSGTSFDSLITTNGVSFRENILFTHAGLSGPASLQASLHWYPGDLVTINFVPALPNLFSWMMDRKRSGDRSLVRTLLASHLAERIAHRLCELEWRTELPLPQESEKALEAFCNRLQAWPIIPSGTVGYGKAEVTRGGVDTDELSSKTLESKKVPGLYFVGEVVDVTGWLGGYNFQWAWASGWAAGQVV